MPVENVKRKTEEEKNLLRDFYFLIENNGNGEEKGKNSKVINFRIDSVLFISTISQELQKHFFILLSPKYMFPILIFTIFYFSVFFHRDNIILKYQIVSNKNLELGILRTAL